MNTVTMEDQIAVEPEPQPIDWVEILSIIWTAKWRIALIVFIVTAAAVAVSLILPETFKSTATLLPETEKGKMASFGGLSDLASLAGLSVGEASLTKLYPAIIKSETILKNVIYTEYQTKKFNEPVNLIKFYEIEGKTPEREYESMLKSLRNEINVAMDNKTNLVTISIETRESQLSADILNNITGELDKFIRTKRTTNASEQRKWIENRLGEVKQDLAKSEEVLKEFREKGISPQLLLEQERLKREVLINSTLYIELKKQYELAKIEEIKNIPIINIMDKARPAAKKENPKRSIIVLVAFFLSGFGSLFLVIIRDRYREQFGRVSQVFNRKQRK